MWSSCPSLTLADLGSNNGLERYNDALAVIEEALRLDPESTNGYISKGQALYGLERYLEALTAFDEALRLNHNSAEAYRGRGQTLSRLGRYAEASEAFEQANKIDPRDEDGAVENEDVEEIRNKPRQRRGPVTTDEDTKAFPGRLRKPFRSRPHSAQRGSHPFLDGVSKFFAVLVVAVIIVVSVLIFHSSVSRFAGGPGKNITATIQATAPATGATMKTVFLILMENHNWADIKGSPSAPYINNKILPKASYAEQYYNPPGNHPSEPNYLWLEAGSNFGILDDNDPATNHLSTKQHLVTLLSNAGISWKSYQEGISGKDCPLSENGVYAPKHNPMVFFDDVTDGNNPNSTTCIAHIRPYSELLTDLQNNTQARYNFITPSLCDDMHDTCPPFNDAVREGDAWLQQNLPAILNSQAYQNGGVVFITWDEGEGVDGPIGLIVLTHEAKGGGYANTIHYTHSSMLRTIEELFGVSPLLGDAANATDLRDLFKTFP